MRVGLHLHFHMKIHVLLRQSPDHVVAQVIVRWPQRQAWDLAVDLSQRLEAVFHRLAVAHQVGHAAEKLMAQRVVLGFVPQALHREVQQVSAGRTARVEEVKQRQMAATPLLQLGVGAGVGRDEGRGADPGEILGELLVGHQLRPRYAHQFHADADETDIVDVRIDMWARPGETHITTIGPRLGKQPLAQVRGQVVVHGEGGLHQTMGFGVAGTLHGAGREVLDQVRAHGVDHALQAGFLVRIDALLGQRQAVVLAPEVVEELQDCRRGLAQQAVYKGPEERLETPFDMQHKHEKRTDGSEDHGSTPSRTRVARWRSAVVSASARITDAAFSAIM